MQGLYDSVDDLSFLYNILFLHRAIHAASVVRYTRKVIPAFIVSTIPHRRMVHTPNIGGKAVLHCPLLCLLMSPEPPS